MINSVLYPSIITAIDFYNELLKLQKTVKLEPFSLEMCCLPIVYSESFQYFYLYSIPIKNKSQFKTITSNKKYLRYIWPTWNKSDKLLQSTINWNESSCQFLPPNSNKNEEIQRSTIGKVRRNHKIEMWKTIRNSKSQWNNCNQYSTETSDDYQPPNDNKRASGNYQNPTSFIPSNKKSKLPNNRSSSSASGNRR